MSFLRATSATFSLPLLLLSPPPPPLPTVLAACRRAAIGQHQEPVLTRDGCS